jgi:nuclear pore complex protein Nup155
MEFARPYRLYESILLIIKTANTPLMAVCMAVWAELVRDAIRVARERNMPVDTLVGERITELLHRFYPSEAATVGTSLTRFTVPQQQKLMYRPAR